MGSAFTVPCVDNKNNVVLVGTHLENKAIEQIASNDNLHPVLKCKLPKNLKIIKFDNFAEEFREKPDLIVIGVSSKGIDWVGKEISKYYSEGTPILLLTKGLAILNNQFETLSEKLNQIFKKNGFKEINISVAKGPCLAAGLANKMRTSIVVANKNISVAKSIGKIISTDYYSTEFSDDVLGIEVCAALKNIYSMIIGASEGLSSTSANAEVKSKHYFNTAASLMHQSISEMAHFTELLKGKKETVYGLGGRNSKMGKYLGNGVEYKKAKSEFMPNDTVEGAELALEIGPKILKEFKKENFPLLMGLLESICNNKKLNINW